LGAAIGWLRAHLLGDQSNMCRLPVRLFVMGANQWRLYPEWPPPGNQSQRWYLQPNGKLERELPTDSNPDYYRYDPADPTPAIGGPRIPILDAGPKDNQALEARPDVLVYTSAPIDEALEVIAPIRGDLYAKSSLEYTDFLMCLCDVYPNGKSINICDGIVPVRSGRVAFQFNGHVHLSFDLWATAYQFGRGHRIRVHVCSGAHPRYVRNTGTGEPLATATKLLVAEQEVYHDSSHPSALVLPVAESSSSR
jgi:putative CocE/NonD family hydrolase